MGVKERDIKLGENEIMFAPLVCKQDFVKAQSEWVRREKFGETKRQTFLFFSLVAIIIFIAIIVLRCLFLLIWNMEK